jgi:spermidine synthase
VIPWRELGRAPVPGGGADVVLAQRGSEFVIRVGSHALMGSAAHGSEEALAELVCARIARRAESRVLIGGLGMGFTLAAALARLPADARVVVAEVIPAIVEWNRGPLAHVAHRPLEDPRVTVHTADVAADLRAPSAFDAILLDVDNGPSGLTRDSNRRLYGAAGLRAAFDSLLERGVLGVWSVAPDRAFARRLAEAGFEVEEEVVRARGTRGGRHTLWLATRPAG